MECKHCLAGGYTYTEQYRHDCEVRHFLSIPRLADRQKFINKVEERRGKFAAERLKEDIRRAWGVK